MHTFLLWLQWPGMILGIAGAPLVASKRSTWRLWGFIIWLLSDVCWLAYGAETHTAALAINYGYFVATAAFGAWNNRKSL